jgi:predicted nucleotidyltransferase component of viral defense system
MHEAIKHMLSHYNCQSVIDYENALKEIIQEVALLGLWRSKFFEQAAFYGGTALRILYGLDRFSEDLDFSLLKRNKNFKLQKFNQAVRSELESFGFDVTVDTKEKNFESNIQSTFIKTETKKQLLKIQLPLSQIHYLPKDKLIKIKMEVDIDPPDDFQTEIKILLNPIPFSVNTFQTPDLFAGKMHAVLCRNWKNRVKGRDWYDLIWYIGCRIPLRLKHLKARLVQNHVWPTHKKLNREDVIGLLKTKIEKLDIAQAKNDVKPFLKDTDSTKLWSQSFFEQVSHQIQVV